MRTPRVYTSVGTCSISRRTTFAEPRSDYVQSTAPMLVRYSTLVMIGALALGCSRIGPACEERTPQPHINGINDFGQFTSDEGQVILRGVNSYPLLDHAGRERWDDIAAIFETARDLDRPVIRTGAYMTGGENPGRLRDADGSLREEGFVALDRVISMAAEHEVQLILVTANHWGNYGGAPAVLEAVAPGEDLPVEAFYTDPRALEHQAAFLRALITRSNSRNGTPYAFERAILAWELVNEARCDDSSRCDEDTLANWASAMGAVIREAEVSQPIAWGGQGYLGQHGEDLERIAQVPEIDILTVHLYPDLGGALMLGGSGFDRVASAVQRGVVRIEDADEIAERHLKVLLIEEAGWRAEGPERDAERAVVLGAWARSAFNAGVGFMPWMIAEPGRPDYDGYLIRPELEPATARVLRCE